MAVWHELKRVVGRFTMKSSTGRVQLVIERRSINSPCFEAYFLKWESGLGTSRLRGEDGEWYRLVPSLPIVGDSVPLMQKENAALLEALDSGTSDAQFHKEHANLALQSEVVASLRDDAYNLSAIICQWPNSRFQIRYSGEIEGSQETGIILNPQIYPKESEQLNDGLQTFADTLEEARKAAVEEMHGIIKSGRYSITKASPV